MAVAATLAVAAPRSQTLPYDRGAAGAWQKLLKLTTTASALHTTAHPDDEHGGMLAMLSRRDGARVTLLTLNRGESGDNAIGPQLFDGLGLIRTEELLVSNRYYGVDQQYFSTVIDYGFSKRMEEVLERWGRENVLRDMVRVIRMERPLVIVSRFQGNQRDGHSNHQTAGLVSQEAFKLAGDAAAFPEQIAEGLRPWQPLKIYIGGAREDEGWSVRVDPGEYSPWLGDSYGNLARLGLSFQRSQTSGRLVSAVGPQPGYYTRVASVLELPAKERGFFDDIDTTVAGVFKALRKPEPAGAARALAAIDQAVAEAVRTFSLQKPAASVPALARGLEATRDAITRFGADADVAFMLARKEQQFQDAVNAALGVELSALAQPGGVQEPTGPFAMFAPPPTMSNVVAGQAFEVVATFVHRGDAVEGVELTLEASRGLAVGAPARAGDPRPGADVPVRVSFPVTVASDAPATNRPYFTRESIQEGRYTLTVPADFGRPASPPALSALARYRVAGVPVEARTTVRRREPNLPYGYELRELAVVPALSVRVSPANAVIALSAATKQAALQVELVNNVDGGTRGSLAIRIPSGWVARPSAHDFAFTRAGERTVFDFAVTPASLEARPYRVEAVATAGDREFREGYEVIAHRDLETRYVYRPSVSTVRGVEVALAPGLKIGYVMGVGDQVPTGIAQLGYEVTLLDARELATGDLSRFDAIMTGTRAYAVRDDLRTYNQRLLDYAKNGGNLVVLYNTQEFVPNRFAPFPAELPPRAEEVSEEDSPVEILAPAARVLTWPNAITKADFEGWIEQRGSKFFTTWDAAYTPIIATWDTGQPPQKGGWLWAPYGRGHYTYFAYAFHRQLPYGVPGAYRLLANVLAMGKR